MKGAEFTLTIARVYETLFAGQIISVSVPGSEGELTILAHHEPLITKLKNGTIIVRTNNDEKQYSITGGLLETSNGKVTILV